MMFKGNILNNDNIFCIIDKIPEVSSPNSSGVGVVKTTVGRGVEVGLGVIVTFGVAVGLGVLVNLGVAVGRGVKVTPGRGVAVGLMVAVGRGVAVSLGVAVGRGVAVFVGVGFGVFVGVGFGVFVGVGAIVGTTKSSTSKLASIKVLLLNVRGPAILPSAFLVK